MALYFYLEFREIQDIYLNLYITSVKRARESRMLHHSMIYADYSIALTRITSQFAWYLRYFRRNTSTALLIPRTDLHKWGSWITANARWIVINKRYKHGGNIRLSPSGLCNFIFQDTLSCNLDSLRRLFNSLVQCQDNKVFYYINIYVIRVISRIYVQPRIVLLSHFTLSERSDIRSSCALCMKRCSCASYRNHEPWIALWTELWWMQHVTKMV